jgi:hypothetical protein
MTTAAAGPIETGGLSLLLWDGSGTVRALNKSVPAGSVWDKTNNFSFVKETPSKDGCNNLGDITIRARPAGAHGDWAFYSSASILSATPVPSTDASVLAAHDLTPQLNATPQVDPNASPKRPSDGVWATIPDKGLTCSAKEYQGDAGETASGAECLAKLIPDINSNYAVWHGESNKNCYLCRLTERGPPSSWKYESAPGAVSYAGTGVLPPEPPAGGTVFPAGVPLKVVRTYESAAAPPGGLVLRFNVTNTHDAAVELGGLGLAMPAAGQMHGIEESVWNDPHIGRDHGFVEWVRVVVDEQTMLAVPLTPGEGVEAWRPIMENTCGGDVWELVTHSKAWAEEWASNKQYPYYYMDAALNATKTWPNPKSAWPAWHGSDTIPVTDFEGMAQPWNAPTSRTLQPGESASVAVQLLLADKGPRTRDAALAAAGKAVMHAVPGYVLSSEIQTATLFVTPPAGAAVKSVASSDAAVLTAKLVHTDAEGASPPPASPAARVAVEAVSGGGGGRARVTVEFDDGTVAVAHYGVVPTATFAGQIDSVGAHWADDAWLPRDFVDAFGRSASVMPYDRETRERVLDDSRAYDVGLSDDAGGGNPLGFAMKVAHAPNAHEAGRLDEYIQWTLYGVKPDTAKPPLKSLQIRPEDGGDTDGIRMTMYYYDDAAHPSANWSGHFAYDYKEQGKCGHVGIEGGPNWCMSESNANATYRVFNFPHHCASYYAMYRVARYHSALKPRMAWQWYLERAANTTIKFGAPKTGVMDGTLFREVLRSLEEEAAEDPAAHWAAAAHTIRGNMRSRAAHFAGQQYPYGSEYSFDTTGQEEVVVWLSHFANKTNGWGAAAERTVDHILSYMRSSPTWPYHGGTRSWGDLGNNGKWMPSVGTAAGFATRGNLHYRSGLNAIPLIEWYRAHPDDFFLLEIAMGAQAGQMMNIDGKGAPSMMMHMLPHVLEFDPHSGDFGLGFFGHTLTAASYFVRHPTMGDVCFLCDLQPGGGATAAAGGGGGANASATVVTYAVRDSYKQRTFIEPLALYLQADAGLFEAIAIDFANKRVTVTFAAPGAAATYTTHRLRADKQSDARPGSGFKLVEPAGAKRAHGAYEFPAAVTAAVLSWE